MSSHKIKTLLRKAIEPTVVFISIILAVIIYANMKIPRDTQKYIYSSIDSVPDNSVAIVLGTSRYIGGRSNPYFTYRIEAAKELYDAGKIKAFVVSGDNRHKSYNEPREMRRALTEVGVPDSIIHQDFAGFRTLDSVVRMGEVFGQKSFVIISQRFHNERAIFLAQYYGYDAYGYDAADLELNRSSYRTKIREVFARVKVFIDILLNTKPKFLGDPVDIEYTSANCDSTQHKKNTVVENDSIEINN